MPEKKSNPEKTQFSTLNESNLHKTLKLYYSDEFSKTEVPFQKWICDIIKANGEIIEIQTGSLTPLKEKIKAAIKEKRSITIVHPVITEKKIEVYTKEGTLVSKRKSPKKETIYTELKKLTGIYDLLLSRYITIIMPEVKTTEQRIQTDTPVLNKNRKTRHPKLWYKSGKNLTEIGSEHILHGKKTYITLLPPLPPEFSSKELKESFTQIAATKSTIASTNLILWLLNKMNLIEEIERKERRIYYKLKK